MPTNHLGQPIGDALPDWSAARLPGNEQSVNDGVEGRCCCMQTLKLAHRDDLYNAFSADREGRMWTYLPVGPFNARDDFDQWFEGICKSTDPLFYAVIDIATSKPLGLCAYMRIQAMAGSIEIGSIAYSPRLQKTVAATEAMYLMMRRAFDELGYRRYEWKCDSHNAASRRAAERLGFTYEGLFRQALVYKQRSRDTVWFSILDKEWPAIKAAFEAWLDPTNFDVSGQQRQRLQDFR